MNSLVHAAGRRRIGPEGSHYVLSQEHAGSDYAPPSLALWSVFLDADRPVLSRAAVTLARGFPADCWAGPAWWGSGAGKVTSICSPPFGWGRAVTVAPWASAMAWTMDRPRPRPSPQLVRCGPSRWNGWKSRSMAVAGTAGPVLATVRTAREFAVLVVTSTRPPGTLWRSALSIRLAARCSARRGLPAAGAGPREV